MENIQMMFVNELIDHLKEINRNFTGYSLAK